MVRTAMRGIKHRNRNGGPRPRARRAGPEFGGSLGDHFRRWFDRDHRASGWLIVAGTGTHIHDALSGPQSVLILLAYPRIGVARANIVRRHLIVKAQVLHRRKVLLVITPTRTSEPPTGGSRPIQTDATRRNGNRNRIAGTDPPGSNVAGLPDVLLADACRWHWRPHNG